MTQKKATFREESSLNNSLNNYTLHLDQLKAAIREEMQALSIKYRFDRLQDRYRTNGYTRSEIIKAVNELVAEGVLEYVRGPSCAISTRMPSVCVWVYLAGEVQE